MTGIDDIRGRVQEIIIHKHLIPGGDEVDVDVESDLKVSVHSQETSERTVDGIMKGNSVEAIEGCSS